MHGDSFRRAEARRDVLDPPCSFFAKPAAMLTAVGADEFAAGGDDTDVLAAWPLAIDEAVELDLGAGNLVHD